MEKTIRMAISLVLVDAERLPECVTEGAAKRADVQMGMLTRSGTSLTRASGIAKSRKRLEQESLNAIGIL